jgi:endoglucanase
MDAGLRLKLAPGLAAWLTLAMLGCASNDAADNSRIDAGPSGPGAIGSGGASIAHDLGTGGASTAVATGSGGSAGSGAHLAPTPNARADAAVAPAAPGYLHTDGAKIVDTNGNEVRLTGLSWFGMETNIYAPHGLWSNSLGSMLDRIKSLGYNMLRLPFCSQFFDPGSTPNSIDTNANPDLVGVQGLALMDKVVSAAGARGLKIVLDRHRPDSGSQSELWYTSAYSEQRWIDDWKMLAQHYKGNTTVIGFDLHNEPHGTATWGDGNMMTDWRLAAERAGNAVLGVNPDLLIIVEGVEKYGKTGGWWGGNLRGAADNPVRLDVANRLVYSAHDYPSSVAPQDWFSDPSYPSNLPSVWHDAWGYLVDGGVAPVWIGEFGTKNQTTSDQQWFQAMASYIAEKKMNFAYWCWNPDSGDTGGILQDDWMTVNQDKQAVLQPILAPLIP